MDQIPVAPSDEKISPKEREMIEWAIDDFQGHPQEQGGITVEQYRNILIGFVSAPKRIDLKIHTIESATRNDLSIQSDLAVVPNVLSQRQRFASGFSQRHHDALQLDAPFAYTIDASLHEGTLARNETRGLMAFRIDPALRVVFVDQIQGGTTDKKTRTKTGRRARMRFKDGMPEYALYDAVRTFACTQGFEAIGIRKSRLSQNATVRELAEKGKETIYEKVARHFGHTEQPPFPNIPESDAYTFERVE